MSATHQAPYAVPLTRLQRLEGTLIVLFAAALAWLVGGHYAKPHTDLIEVWETGEALLSGELPRTLKRAPLQPVCVALISRITGALGILSGRDNPAQPALHALGMMALVANAWLFLALARRVAGGGAWAAWWLVSLPIGLSVTAYGLTEPLIVTVTLATLLARARLSRWAYVFAALAALTRYDAAGLILGNFIGDLCSTDGRRRVLAGALTKAALSALPLSVWLVLTAATWMERSDGHYLRQIARSPRAELAATAELPLRVTVDFDRIRFPLWLVAFDGESVRVALRAALVTLALAGVLSLASGGAWRGAAWATTAAGFLAGYLGVHAVFEFNFERFGYPPAFLYLLAAARGGAWLSNALSFKRVVPQNTPGAEPAALSPVASGPVAALTPAEPRQFRPQDAPPRCTWVLRPGLVGALSITGAVLCAGPLWLHGTAFEFVAQPKFSWARALPWVSVTAALALIAIGVVQGRTWSDRLARLTARMLLAVVFLANLQSGAARLGPGSAMENLMRAARWVREETRPKDVVAGPVAGLLRFVSNAAGETRFIEIHDFRAGDPQSLAVELAAAGVRYVFWYDGLLGEIGEYYIAATGLDRFAYLQRPTVWPAWTEPERLEIAAEFPGRPHVWVFRICR